MFFNHSDQVGSQHYLNKQIYSPIKLITDLSFQTVQYHHFQIKKYTVIFKPTGNKMCDLTGLRSNCEAHL